MSIVERHASFVDEKYGAAYRQRLRYKSDAIVTFESVYSASALDLDQEVDLVRTPEVTTLKDGGHSAVAPLRGDQDPSVILTTGKLDEKKPPIGCFLQ